MNVLTKTVQSSKSSSHPDAVTGKQVCENA